MYSQIEQEYLDNLLAAKYPAEPSIDGMQLAAADTTRLPEVVVTGEAEPAPAVEKASLDGVQLAAGSSETRTDIGEAKLIKPVGAMGALKTIGEAIQSGAEKIDFDVLGLPGIGTLTLKDLTVGNLGKVLVDIAEGFPPITGKGETLKPTMESIELINAAPVVASTVKLAKKAAPKIAESLGPAAADVLENQLRKAGMIMDIVPEGPAQVVIPVKVGEREVKIPAQQAAVLQRAIKNLTPQEQAKFKSDTAVKFVNILKQLPGKEEFGAAAVAGKAKKGWYEGSTQAIIQVFGPDSQRFAALLSATSPQTSVESNLFNALQIWKNWTAAGRPVDRESIVRVMGESVQGGKGEESVLDAWINNSVKALSAEDPSTVVLSGPKVNSFMLNLQGNVNEVTNDAWMAAFTYVDQNLFKGSLTKTDPGKGPGYLAMNARVRETADYLTKLTGEKWTPAEVQETIWSWAKTLYETASAKGETRTAVQLIQDNAITDELIAATPDFRTLFYDDRFAPILEQAGYTEQLNQLRAATSGSDVAAGAKKPGAGSQAGAIDPEAQRKYLERNAKRLDKLRKDREREAAAKAKAKAQEQSGGVK